MLLLGLVTFGVAVLGLRALLQRRWGRGRTLGLIAVAGGVASGVLPAVLASAVASGSIDPVHKARLLVESFTRVLNCGVAGLLALPLGSMVALMSFVGGRKSRR
ncbi:hypothetical protein WMF31_42270 [Sorangium sp. So ce1036]|uniref:hypothetical protein n=1 Tax=Sorangium sp. So ce1036 TaxID=3133328 RepID=UPI003EFC918B